MKKITQLLLLTLFACTITYGQQITLMDFGVSVQQTAGNWNNITVQNVLNTATPLVDNMAITTGEVLTLTDEFDLYNINNEGTLSPVVSFGGSSLPITASRDSFFGESLAFDNDGANPASTEITGGFTLSNLEAGKYYSFKIFASRATLVDNYIRETLYTITGAAAQTATLDATNNLSDVATINNVQPDGSNNITIQATTGGNNDHPFGFYYLGAIEMTKTDTTLSNKSFGINGLVNIYPNPSFEYVNISLSLNEAARVQINLYDITGKKVKTILNEQKSAGNFVQTWNRSNVASGLYILEIDADGRKHNSKLLLK